MKRILEIALAEYGQKEIAGIKHNQTIVGYAKEAGFEWVNDDETPWCSIFINWCALKAGCVRSNAANARSWLDTGELVLIPEMGDVVVFKRGIYEWQGHVGLYINTVGDMVNVLGGNQSNQVKISSYPLTDVLGFRKLK